MQSIRATITRLIITLVMSVALFVSGASVVSASASFYLYPSSGIYTIGDEFEVDVRVNTNGEDIISAGGKILFNENSTTKELEVVTINTEDSIFSTWFPAPSFNNEIGEINFEGIIGGGQGFSGEEGNVMTITFRALQNVSSKVRFQAGSAILALDGRGTNILTEMESGVYALNPKEVVPDIEYVVRGEETPLRSPISSRTHPTQEGWYATTTAQFSWELPGDATAVRILVDDEPATQPTVLYANPIEGKEITDIGEGRQFFHLQIQNAGGWGEVSHYAFKSDITAPADLVVREELRQDTHDPSVSFMITATDTPSGIEHFEIFIDGEKEVWTPEVGETLYTPSNQFGIGTHAVSVYAYDFAGNVTTADTSFDITALPAPTITDYPALVTTDGEIVVSGSTFPQSEVTLFFQKDDGAPVRAGVKSSANGSFVYTMEGKLDDGTYALWAVVVTPSGAKSEAGQRVQMTVQPTGVIIFGEKAYDALLIFVPAIGLLILLIFMIIYGWKRISLYRRRVTQEVGEAQEMLHGAFDTLRADTQSTLHILDKISQKRRLTQEEEEVRARLKHNLAVAEASVAKEIEDISEVFEEPQEPVQVSGTLDLSQSGR